MLKPGTYLQDRYEILEQIGQGGMSVVYKARCHTLNRDVAIKVLKEEFTADENFVSKFKMEAQAAARLSHPNIVSVYDVVDEGDLHYIVMELVEGITLKAYIEKKGRLENREAIGIALQVISGIAAAHEHHIIHRDIKPQNIIIAKNGKVKVADFGIARAVSTQTINATAVGSVHYISPEQARGGYCDERSDIYSFGITLYEMVTGRVPFEGDNTVAVALAHLEEPVISPRTYNPEISTGLEQVILRCTKKHPDERYASAQEVTEDLRRLLVDPDVEVAAEKEEESTDLTQTRPISREELGDIRRGRRAGTRRASGSGGQSGRLSQTRRTPKSEEGDVSSQFERIITIIGVVAAILVVAVVFFLFSQLTGFLRPGSGISEETEISSTAEAQTAVEISLEDNQVGVPSVLGLEKDAAEKKLKDYSLSMKVSGEEYSDTYEEGQVMSQNVVENTIVDKWSTIDVTISKGSDRVELTALGLEQMTGDAARTLLEERELTVDVVSQYNDTVAKDQVIRYSPDTARAGDTVVLYVSKGPQAVQGRVPNLLGKDPASADAELAAAGLTTGEVTYDTDESLPEGVIIRQSELAGTMLEPQTPVGYVVNSAAEASSAAGASAEDTGEVKYYASIDETCSLSNYIGPAAQTSSLRIMVRLKQTVNNVILYRTLIKPRLVVGSQDVPIVISRIEGAPGVDTGTVEVVNADDLESVIASYPVTFFPAS